MNKVDHIHHLEDLVLMNHYASYKALLALQVKSYAIKYDGAPALVFGISPTENKFFLSTKSYFNKTPKINYSIEDIHRNHGARSPGLTEKLIEIFPKMEKFYKNYLCLDKDNSIFQGDLLFTELDEKGSFTPNTITYKFTKTYWQHEDYELGLAIHTRYDKDGERYQMNYLSDEGSIGNKVYLPHKEVYNYLSAIKKPAAVRKAWEAINPQDYNKLTFVNISDPLKDINYLIRNDIEINEQSIKSVLYKYNYSIEIVNFYLECLKYKRILIDYLDERSSYDGLSMAIGDKSVGHEGYVADVGGDLIKLVHREIFSFHNFEKNG